MNTKTVTLADAKAHLSELTERASGGLIARYHTSSPRYCG